MYAKKLLSDPYDLFLKTAAMFFKNPYTSSMLNTKRNIHTKLDFNWSSGARREKKLTTTTDDNDGRR